MSGYSGMTSKYIKKLEEYKIINNTKNRFYSKILLPNINGCMEWQGALRRGYGAFHFQIKGKNKIIPAHRFSYKLFIGNIPNNKIICHKCDNRRCVSPEHLFLGTHKKNSQDMVNKGRNFDQRGEKNCNFKINYNIKNEVKFLLKLGKPGYFIASKLNISQASVSRIKHENKGD